MPAETVTINGRRVVVNDVLIPWQNRKKQAEVEIKPYLTQVRINRMFAAGKQHLDLNERDGRILERRERNGVELLTSNFLDQYINTVIGRLGSNDYKPNFHVSREDEMFEEIAQMINKGFSWGWDNEWAGDRKVQDILRHLAIDGTLGVRTRYDRRYGEIIGDVPYKDGSPILDSDEQAKYVAEKAGKGEYAEFGTLRAGKICWELLTLDNLLPPPGIADPYDFPWEIIQRPVSVTEVKNRYGDLADDVVAEEIDNIGSITAGYNTDGKPTQLSNMVMVYTGYEKPNQLHKNGCTVVFTDSALLDYRESLPLDEHPKGPRSGVHYFRWQTLPGRFVGKAFIENGLGPQKIYNKRHTQVNAIIDRSMPKVYMEENSMARPKTGEPMEIIEIRPGAPLPKQEQGMQPGTWMMEDIKLQVESVERALGIRGVSMGQAPQGVAAYSAMALLSENDALKLDPIAQDFAVVMDELCWDTMEQMRNWPADKKMEILGPDGRLETFLFNAANIPERYIVKRPHGGALPRSQAAEIQKINDIWTASQGRLPLTWYVDSLNAGKPMNIPPSIGDSDAHKAELENVIIQNTMQAPPVAPYDDDLKHVEIHRTAQMEAQSRLDLGDFSAQPEVDAFEQHIQEHEASAAANQVPPLTPPMGGMMPQPGAAPAPTAPPVGADLLTSLANG